MNIVPINTAKWTATIRECGVEFGGDHHLYVDFLTHDGRDCRAGMAVKIGRAHSDEEYSAVKPLGEPSVNVPIWRGETLRVEIPARLGGSDAVLDVSTSTSGGNLYHKSFHLVFRERLEQSVDPTPEPAPTHDSEKQTIINILKQAIGLLEDLQ